RAGAGSSGKDNGAGAKLGTPQVRKAHLFHRRTWADTIRAARLRAGPPNDPEEMVQGSLTVLQAIVLGLTQGLTEFAPVSSSGHLILVPWLFHWSILNDTTLNKTFDVALHVGTFVGAAVYFRQDIARYVRAWVRSIRRRSTETVDERLAWY